MDSQADSNDDIPKSVEEILSFGSRGRNTERKAHILLIQFMMIKLGDDFWNAPYGSVEPLLRKYGDRCGKVPCVLRRWYYHYLSYGEVMPDSALYKKQPNTQGREVLGPEDTKKLKAIVKDDPSLFLDEMRERLPLQSGTWWFISKIHSVLTKELEWTLKIASVRARQQNELDRNAYKTAIEQCVIFPEQVVFLDETFKGRNASRQRRCWLPRGVTPVLIEHFSGHHTKRYSMLAACSINGFLKEACAIVRRDEDGTVDLVRFLEWVKSNLCPLLGRYNLFEPCSIVVLDNASIHHNDEVVAAIKATGAKVIYTAPYSPDLNPIEWFFAQ